MLAAERQAVFDWVRTFDLNVQFEDVVIILLQRSAMDSIGDLSDGKCEEDVPSSSRPSYLRTLLQQRLTRGLILPSVDSLFAHETTLLRLLVGDSNMVADDPCIPIFPILLHSPSGIIGDEAMQFPSQYECRSPALTQTAVPNWAIPKDDIESHLSDICSVVDTTC